MIGAYPQTLDVSKMEPMGELVDIDRCVTCRSRAVCVSTYGAPHADLTADVVVGGHGTEKSEVRGKPHLQ